MRHENAIKDAVERIEAKNESNKELKHNEIRYCCVKSILSALNSESANIDELLIDEIHEPEGTAKKGTYKIAQLDLGAQATVEITTGKANFPELKTSPKISRANERQKQVVQILLNRETCQ